MGDHTDFPPAGQPKDDPKKTTGKTMQELTDEKRKELDEGGEAPQPHGCGGEFHHGSPAAD